MAEYHDPFHAPSWGQEDAEALRSFLVSKTGKRLIFRLQNERPSAPHTKEARSSMEANALFARELIGYETAVRNLFDYLVTDVAQGASATVYPSLDDDAAWEDELNAKAPLLPPKPEQQKVPNEGEIDLDNLPKPE